MKTVFGVSLFLILLIPTISLAHGEVLAIQETVIPMSISENNKLPWGFVEGKIASHAEQYPVIIQIYQGEKPVHFAQVPVNDDGTYQYRFRVLDITDGKTTRIFNGEYTVKIFKMVELDSNYLDYLVGQKKSGFDISIDILDNL
jgi:hypothetical protein